MCLLGFGNMHLPFGPLNSAFFHENAENAVAEIILRSSTVV